MLFGKPRSPRRGERKVSPAREIENSWAANPDGAGIAWASGGRNRLRKGFMDPEEFLRFYRRARLPLPHVVHFRLASAGGVDPRLCHPFPADPAAPVDLEWSGRAPLLFHNGTIPEWKRLYLQFLPEILRELRRRRRPAAVPPGPWPDTRAAAAVAGAAGIEVLRFVEGGKYAVFDRGRIRIFGDFLEEDGALFSNPSFRGASASRSGFRSGRFPAWIPSFRSEAGGGELW